MSDYLKVVYNETDRPLTGYPMQLCAYLFQVFEMQAGMSFLEVGCGRGEFLKSFKTLGVHTHGCDLSPYSADYQKDIEIKTCDVEKDGLNYPDNTFDILYSKSFLEHLYYPEKYMKEAYRVLKPGGLLLSLVPDWEANYKIYFDDYTHRRPFTSVSLLDIYKIFEFEQTRVVKFRQLPIVWKYPSLNYFCAAISPFIPHRTTQKFLRWSRELMLIGSGRKPIR